MTSFSKVFAAMLAVAAIVGVVSEQVGERSDRKRLPQIGRSVDIGGRSLNIFCSGDGSPTVVFDAGANQPGYAWAGIQPEVATFTRSCWFDRAGFGWSDPGSFPRTSVAMSRELHELLHRGGVLAPYVLVGHSLGGLNARVYTGLYPKDVAGLVLVDAAHEDEPKRAPKFMLGHTAPRWLWHPIWVVAQTARLLGVIRLLTPRGQMADDPAKRSRQQILEALRRQPKTIATHADASIPESYAEAEAADGLGDRPLIVLTQGKIPSIPHPTQMDREYAAYLQVWMHEIQPKLARLSTHGRQVIVDKSGHGIPTEAPEFIIAAVRDVVADVRNAQALREGPSGRNGSGFVE